jgi:predicted MPP superfamily phosphohydrolase
MLWVTMTTIGVVTSMGSWFSGDVSEKAEGVKPMCNAIQMLVLPGWAVIRLTSHYWHASPLMGALVANAIGWGLWWWAAHFAVRLRNRVVSKLSRRGGEVAEVEMADVQAGDDPPVDLSRRRWLVDAPLALVTLGGAGAIAEAAFIGPWRLTVARYTVPIVDLPRPLDGLRIVQIADPHLGPRVPSAFVREAVDKAIALKPDLFFLAGDYIHNGTHFIKPAAALMRPLVETNKPVVGVLGNHDWYGDGEAMSEALSRVGVRMIDNDRTYLTADRHLTRYPENGAVCIAGLGDLLESYVDVQAALERVDPNMPRLVLAHNPDTAEIREFKGYGGPPPRIDLMLSGHTHGGQVSLPLIGPPIVPSRYGQKYSGGLVQGPAFRVLISRGVGMSLVPVRFNVPPELVEITLTRA